MNVTLAATAALLFAIGTSLVLQRKLSRIVIGLGILTHGGNVLLLGSGSAGLPPFIGSGDRSDFSDPLPESLVLTAIVGLASDRSAATLNNVAFAMFHIAVLSHGVATAVIPSVARITEPPESTG